MYFGDDKNMNILLIGSGGREYSIGLALASDDDVEEI